MCFGMLDASVSGRRVARLRQAVKMFRNPQDLLQWLHLTASNLSGDGPLWEALLHGDLDSQYLKENDMGSQIVAQM